MKKKTKVLIITLLILIVIGTSVGLSYAYFTGQDEVKNTFTMGNTDISLTEPNWNSSNASKVIPGSVIVKDPTLTGVAGDSYARIVVEFYDTKTNQIITDAARLEQIKRVIYYDTSYDASNSPVTTFLSPNTIYSNDDLSSLLSTGKIKNLYNDSEFVLDTTRSTDSKLVYNYSKILHKNDKKVLFSNIVIPSNFTDYELNEIGSFKVNVYAEAIQSDYTNSQEAAYSSLDVE